MSSLPVELEGEEVVFSLKVFDDMQQMQPLFGAGPRAEVIFARFMTALDGVLDNVVSKEYVKALDNVV